MTKRRRSGIGGLQNWAMRPLNTRSVDSTRLAKVCPKTTHRPDRYGKAAGQGHTKAQFAFALITSSGEGVQQDFLQAAGLYRKAAEQGDADAQANLGLMYDFGRGVPQDDVEAVKWYRKAAEQGNAVGAANLGIQNLTGHGVAKSYEEAYAWFRKAADSKNVTAAYFIGRMHHLGEGRPRDAALAVRVVSARGGTRPFRGTARAGRHVLARSGRHPR